jgi:peptidoglycan hydrolase-like protein with peptidoglycan-binding domain
MQGEIDDAATAASSLAGYSVSRSSKEYIRWYQTALNGINFAGLAVDGVAGSKTHAAVRVFQRQRGLVADGIVGARTEAALLQAGAGRPPVAPAPTPSRTNAAVDTPLPRSAPGLYTTGHPASRQFGTKQTIDALLAIGRRWVAAYPNGPRIGIGEISLRGGGKMPGHVSHQRGVDADIHLMRNDGSEDRTTYRSASYSRALTQQLVDMIRTTDVQKVEIVFFNDPRVSGVTPWPGHDNHLHVRFKPGATSSEFEYEFEFESHGTRCGCPGCRTAFLSENEQFIGEAFNTLLGPATPGGSVPRKSPPYVRWYQDALNKLLPANLVVDGKAGPKTRAAVLAFQRRGRLKADGIVGPATERALLKAGASPPPSSGPPAPGPSPHPGQPAAAPCGPSPSLSAAEGDVLAATSTLEGGRPFHCAVSATDGISMGSMQWNLKAGTLQKMINDFETGTGRLATFFAGDIDRLRRLIDLAVTSKANAVAQATAEGLAARWRGPLTALCADPFFCTLQQRDIASRLCTAWNAFTALGLSTVRGLSMSYDIQNGDGSGALATVRSRALASPGWSSLSEAAKLERLANLAADRISSPTLGPERRARRLNLANIRTLYRGSPATPGKSWADKINVAVPNLDRALTLNQRTVCNAPSPNPPQPRAPTPPPGPRLPSAPGALGEAGCPVAGENATGCRTPRRCNAIADLVCLSSVAGTPIEYLYNFSKTRPITGQSRPRPFRMRPGVRDAVARFTTLAAGFGIPVELILSQGAYLCRCQRDSDALSNHGKGEAIDVGGVRLSPAGREVLAVNFTDPGERVLIRRVNACLRLAFPRVLDYNYNAAHHDHFHCEIGVPAREARAVSTVRFVQEALALVLGRVIPNTGKFDAATQRALRDFGAAPEDLTSAARLNTVYDRLFTQVARGSK